MKKTRLTLIILGLITYIVSLGFFIYLSITTFKDSGSNDFADVLALILFILIVIGYGAMMFFIPFILSLTALILTIKLNNNGGSLNKVVPIILTILPVITEIVMVSAILIYAL